MNAFAPLPPLLRSVSARIPTEIREFTLYHYTNNLDKKEHLALVAGDVNDKPGLLVRVHSECFTGDVLGSRRCDCGEQLQKAMQMVASEGAGVILYLRQEGRGIGLADKLRAYNLQDAGYDTVEANLLLGHQADEREYGVAAAILCDLGVSSIRLLTNNPTKVEQLAALGIQIEGVVALEAAINSDNARYLATKVEKMRHLLALPQSVYALARSNESGSTLVDAHNGSHPAAAQTACETTVANEVRPFRDEINAQLAQLQEQFIAHRRQDRPFVTLSYAQSLDGSIAAQPGHPLRLSSEGAMRLTHALRSLHDAILVGVGAVLADDPRLTVRLIAGRNPQPVIMDSHLRTPPSAKILQHPKPPWFAATQSTTAAQQALVAQGGKILATKANGRGQVDLRDLLTKLAQLGIRSLMVEGGSQVLTSFLRSGLADFVVVTVAPRFVGGLRVVAGDHDGATFALPTIQQPRYTVVEGDMIVWGEIHQTTVDLP